MNLWTIEIRDHTMADDPSRKNRPNTVIDLKRDGILIASIYPCEEPTPGIQICSFYLDLKNGELMPEECQTPSWPLQGIAFAAKEEPNVNGTIH